MRYQLSRPLRRLPAFLFLTLIVVAAASTVAARPAAEGPRLYCRHIGNNDVLRPIPAALAPTAGRLFDLGTRYAAKTTYYRCANRNLMLCNVGANLPCGKANQNTESPAATHWCRDHRNATVVPMVVTGHDTIYQWQCVGGLAKPIVQNGKVDRRGFFLEYWKKG